MGYGLAVGIVGLPNAGKSTLFNALLKKQQAFVANYPFATIEPNIGIVPVPDKRLQVLAGIVAQDIKKLSNKEIKENSNPSITNYQLLNYPPIVPATVKFVDIAGLIKGAAEGAGLGNKFLSHIREVSIIAHVVRAFEDPNVVKEGSVDPKSDYQIVQTELILADIQSLEKSKGKNSHSAKASRDKQNEVLKRVAQTLNQGIAVRDMQFSDEEKEEMKQLSLLSAKPEMIVLNVSETDYNTEGIKKTLVSLSSQLYNGTKTKSSIVICAKIEAELSELSEDEQKEYLKNLGLEESGLERLLQKAYENLGLISFLTAGEKEVRAWTVRKRTKAVDAAGVIHTDFTKHFIKVEVINAQELIKIGSWQKAHEKGKIVLHGRDYVVQDGDVLEFKVGT